MMPTDGHPALGCEDARAVRAALAMIPPVIVVVCNLEFSIHPAIA
jgi:hypothetical protein